MEEAFVQRVPGAVPSPRVELCSHAVLLHGCCSVCSALQVLQNGKPFQTQKIGPH